MNPKVERLEADLIALGLTPLQMRWYPYERMAGAILLLPGGEKVEITCSNGHPLLQDTRFNGSDLGSLENGLKTLGLIPLEEGEELYVPRPRECKKRICGDFF
jgi:hypothetical protein